MDLQVASESQEGATAPESEIVYPPEIATSQALSHLVELITFEALPASDLESTDRHSVSSKFQRSTTASDLPRC